MPDPFDPIVENARIAAACGADPAMLLAVALATADPGSVEEAFAVLDRYRDRLVAAAKDDAPPTSLAALGPDETWEPELARFVPEADDHELRGRRVFAELTGRWSFLRVAAFAIGGVELSEADADLLGHLGVVTQLADPRIWPLAVTRRIAARTGRLAPAVVGGVASMLTPRMSARPVAGFMRFLDEVEGRAPETPEEVVASVLREGRRVLGVGRPVRGMDERVPRQVALLMAHGRADGPSVTLALRVGRAFAEERGVHLNSAGLHGALMRDLGFRPPAAAAFCVLYFLVPVLAHAAFPAERGARFEL